VKIFARAEVVRLITVLRGRAIYRYANAAAADIRMHAWQQNEKALAEAQTHWRIINRAPALRGRSTPAWPHSA